jgi:hypothetical protein
MKMHKKYTTNREYAWIQSKVDFSEHIWPFSTMYIIHFVIIYKQTETIMQFAG